MNQAELVAAIAGKTGQTKADARAILTALLDTIADTLARGDSVNLTGFGTFKTVQREAREGRNPATGETITIGPSTVPKFVPGKTFKSKVNGGGDSPP